MIIISNKCNYSTNSSKNKRETKDFYKKWHVIIKNDNFNCSVFLVKHKPHLRDHSQISTNQNKRVLDTPLFKQATSSGTTLLCHSTCPPRSLPRSKFCERVSLALAPKYWFIRRCTTIKKNLTNN